MRPVGAVLAAALAVAVGVGVGVSDVFALHDSRVAPRDRMLALREAGDRLAGRGPILFNEAEEFAKYFGGRRELNASTESITPLQVQLRAPTSVFGQYFDLDLQLLPYVQRFPNILKRRSPSASRPPAQYRQVFANRYYEGWIRGSSPKVLVHLPLQGRDKATAPAACSDVRSLVRTGRRLDGDVALVAAPGPEVVTMDTTPRRALAGPRARSVRPGDGLDDRSRQGGRADQGGPRSGAYRLWVRGTFPRATFVSVDGVRRATVRGSNTPGQWLGNVAVRLTAGTHEVEVLVPGGSPRPGDGAIVTVGPVAFVAARSAGLQTVPLARWRSLCGRELDWIELVRRG